MKIMTKFFASFFAVLLTGLPATVLWAYTSVIALEMENVWQAALAVSKPLGMDNVDHEKWKIRTEWVEDEIKRSKKILPFTKKGPEIKRTYMRRYRLNVELRYVEGRCEVKIWGEFQQKPYSQDIRVHWKKIKPASEDYELERQHFYAILDYLRKERLPPEVP